MRTAEADRIRNAPERVQAFPDCRSGTADTEDSAADAARNREQDAYGKSKPGNGTCEQIPAAGQHPAAPDSAGNPAAALSPSGAVCRAPCTEHHGQFRENRKHRRGQVCGGEQQRGGQKHQRGDRNAAQQDAENTNAHIHPPFTGSICVCAET